MPLYRALRVLQWTYELTGVYSTFASGTVFPGLLLASTPTGWISRYDFVGRWKTAEGEGAEELDNLQFYIQVGR